MSATARLVFFVAGLAVVFAAMFVAGRTLVPDETVATWTREASQSTEDHGQSASHGADAGHEQSTRRSNHASGLAIEQDGYRLTAVSAPGSTGESGKLSFRVLDPEGGALTEYATNHEKELHLIVVRSDGTEFRHVHPKLDRGTGTWSLPWIWSEGGTYRVFTDFVPAGGDPADALTLSRSVEVAGAFEPVRPVQTRSDRVDGFEVTLSGGLETGESRELTATIAREGEPVTDLQPYLGAFGHLVALREGDLAYLHVHTAGDESAAPGAGDDHGHGSHTAGPEIDFMTEAPTPGRYLLYLDFRVDGEVHTAEFVLEAE